ncbi:hypothetical protein KP509_29G086300 [Ceratopteris richardii]|nr:hypothetical protein KP509_29G086300 [Ceratopteris richardii]
MEVCSSTSSVAWRLPNLLPPVAGLRRLPASKVRAVARHVTCSLSSSSPSSSPTPVAIVPDESAKEEPRADASAADGILTSDAKVILCMALSLGLAFGYTESAMALGPEGPLVEEFWDNMRRYGLYFLTVFTGGLYSIVQPIFALLRNPITAILTITFLSGSFYLLYLLLNTMLGITNFNYEYS